MLKRYNVIVWKPYSILSVYCGKRLECLSVFSASRPQRSTRGPLEMTTPSQPGAWSSWPPSMLRLAKRNIQVRRKNSETKWIAAIQEAFNPWKRWVSKQAAQCWTREAFSSGNSDTLRPQSCDTAEILDVHEEQTLWAWLWTLGESQRPVYCTRRCSQGRLCCVGFQRRWCWTGTAIKRATERKMFVDMTVEWGC